MKYLALLINLLLITTVYAETNAEKLNTLGEKYHFARGHQRNYQKAREHYLKAVELGSATAANHLARIYLNGEGVKADPRTADMWYAKSVELDPSVENKCVNNLHDNKITCGLILAALQNSAPAQYQLATIYETGGTELGQHVDKAFKLYLSAAKKGDFFSKVAVARCYRLGIGVNHDLNESNKWHRDVKKLDHKH